MDTSASTKAAAAKTAPRIATANPGSTVKTTSVSPAKATGMPATLTQSVCLVIARMVSAAAEGSVAQRMKTVMTTTPALQINVALPSNVRTPN
jgi:hypothetical protein